MLIIAGMTKFQALYSKATKSELARRYDQAYEHYVRAAELFLHLSRSSQEATEQDKAKWKGNVQRALDRAEKIKGSLTAKAGATSIPPPGPTSPNPPSNTLLTPVSINHFASRRSALYRAHCLLAHLVQTNSTMS